MKRALAERAKQSAGLPNNATTSNRGDMTLQSPVGHPLPVSSASIDINLQMLPPDGCNDGNGRPLKVPRRSENGVFHSGSQELPAPTSPEVPASSENGVQSEHGRTGADQVSVDSISDPKNTLGMFTNAQSKAIHPGFLSTSSIAMFSNSAAAAGSSSRQHTSTSFQSKIPLPAPSDDEDEDNQQSSFFLKHQNRALASELKALQYQLSLLENERSYRRRQCRIAGQALNSLQATWTQMETELHPSHLSQLLTSAAHARADAASHVKEDGPMSTGTGSKVELVGALFDALDSLATCLPPNLTANEIGEEYEVQTAEPGTLELDSSEKQQLDDLSSISWKILQRANTLEQWIRSLLQKATSASSSLVRPDESNENSPFSTDQRALIKELGILRGQCREYKIQIAELGKARDDTAKSERKVRRSIYRLATGRVKIDQVLKDMEKSDEDGTLAAEAKIEALAQKNPIPVSTLPESVSVNSLSEGDKRASEKSGKAEFQELEQMRKQLKDLENQLLNRDNNVQELQAKLTESEQRINLLCSKELSEDDVERVQLHQKSQKRLEQAEHELSDLREKLKETRKYWAQACGDAETALKALEDMQAKQKKRWEELTVGLSEGEVDLPMNMDPLEQAKKIIELDHKLKQALENVRQADAVRQNLKEALAMNSSLQGKLDEIKAKYAALQAGRSNTSGVGKGASDAGNHGPSSSVLRDKLEKAEAGGKSDKLHREHRRMRKEIAALAASKDAAKSKLERIEKERDVLMETNARLLKQSAEKDDMNAKSLSTILHLKNLTEQLTQGKISLEQQLKSAGQLSLASRLATNAKDRVAEEVMKEKESVEKKLRECESRNQALKEELDSTVNDWSEADSKISILNSQITKSAKRNDELVVELEREQKERRKLQDSLDVAVRRAGDATDKLNEIAKREGSSFGAANSVFTVEQLNTQISVLKSRLACPVCHYRDKDCIIMRCRHMFCKHCVEENIQNRSRKCPSCGLKFSEKDVDDVWL